MQVSVSTLRCDLARSNVNQPVISNHDGHGALRARFVGPYPKEKEMRRALGWGAGILTLAAASAQAEMVTVTVENLSPENGTYITPVWVGFHNGLFDTHTIGNSASEAVERLAEDGNTSFISNDFTNSGSGVYQATLDQIGPIAPGASVSMSFDLDGSNSLNRYFSFLSMVIPSNDAFIGNDNALGIPVFDEFGGFLGADFIVAGFDGERRGYGGERRNSGKHGLLRSDDAGYGS
jgi:hypothetical protein